MWDRDGARTDLYNECIILKQMVLYQGDASRQVVDQLFEIILTSIKLFAKSTMSPSSFVLGKLVGGKGGGGAPTHH